MLIFIRVDAILSTRYGLRDTFVTSLIFSSRIPFLRQVVCETSFVFELHGQIFESNGRSVEIESDYKIGGRIVSEV